MDARHQPRASAAATRQVEPTQYLNVDLDIISLSPLNGVVEAMGQEAFVLYVGRRGRKHAAHIELTSSHMDMSADRAIAGLVQLVEALPPRHRLAWDGAQSREFNISASRQV